ncbi:MAG: glycoside hydrolase family protein [Thermomicrobia bacterium]|nr:glycoside hydrolase family protein [Thermomicrobia bacterium]
MRFRDQRGLRRNVVLMLLLLLTLLPTAQTLTPASAALTDPYPDRDGFFGVVGRDPIYEWNTDTIHFNNDVNKTVLEQLVKQMAESGAKWVRIEFFAEYGDLSGPGRMPYEKYDWFLTDLCKRYNMNVLGLLSYGIVRDTNPTYILNKVNDPADQSDGSNPFIRGFADRAAEIAGHYAGYVNAWEVINEPNANTQLDFITQGQQQRIFPDRMAAIMSLTYPRLKGISPDVPVMVGGLINAPGAYPDNYDVPYLRQVYQSPLIKGHGGAPWDAVADHPYDLTAAAIPGHVRDLHAVMEQAGEGFKKIWVTEFGMQAAAPAVPESGIIPVTDDEAKQSAYLSDTLSALSKMRDIVERAFWFKLEDFTLTQGNEETHWGLFAFRRDGDHPGEPWPRKDALRAYASLARPSALPTAPEDANKPTAPDATWFPDTKHWLAGPFRLYWERNGGVERFGLPRTSVYTTAGRVVQIFERARFEFHDEFAGTPNEVLLTLLGSVTTHGRTFPTVPRPLSESDVYFPSPNAPTRPPATPTPTPAPTPKPATPGASGTPGAAKTETPAPTPPPPPFSGMYFTETSHTLTGPFLQFWKQGGGLPVFGYPISEPIIEKNADDGKLYTVQYFERTRLEYHPEFKDNPLPVLEGLLGNDLIRSGGWWR